MARKLTIILGCALLLAGLLLWGCGGPETTTPSNTPTTTTNPTGTPPPTAATAPEKIVYRVADHWDEVQKLYQFSGEAAKPLTEKSPSPMPKFYPNGLPSVKGAVIFAHPASSKKGQTGDTILRFTVSLPSQPAKLAFTSFVTKSQGPTDGADFIVKVGGQQVFKELVTPKASLRRSVDLSAYAGKSVTIELITDAGPNKNASADWAMWHDPRVVTAP